MTDVWQSLLFVWLVHSAARGIHGPMGTVLAWRPLVYIGTVSYGIYLFHIFVVPAAKIIEGNIGVNLPIPPPGFGPFVVVAVTSIAAAALSWTVFERPINNQKHRFPYVRPRRDRRRFRSRWQRGDRATCPVRVRSSVDDQQLIPQLMRCRGDRHGQVIPAEERSHSMTIATL